MSETGNLIVVGTGIAGVSAAEAARAEYPGARITLVGLEPYPFYNRIALNSFITGKKTASQMHFYPLGWLDQQRIESRYGDGVVAIDRKRKIVELAGGSSLAYDTLILALGAFSKLPAIEGLDSPLVHPLWSLDDATVVREGLSRLNDITIIGGGVLGVETAVDLANMGKSVTLVEARDRVMPLHLNAEGSGLYRAFLENKGINVLLATSVDSVQTKGGSAHLVASGIPAWDADMVLVQTGVLPNASLARAAGLECGQGIIVDQYMRTSDPDILACGNCVELDGHLALLWNPAREQGEVSGLNAFENKISVKAPLESIHVKLSELPTFACGDPHSVAKNDRLNEERDGADYRLLRFGGDGALLGALLLGNTDGYYEFEKATRQKTRVSSELIAEGKVDSVKDYLRGDGHDYVYRDGKWVCRMCGYAYEGEYPPAICPVCSVGRDQFLKA